MLVLFDNTASGAAVGNALTLVRIASKSAPPSPGHP